VGRRAELEHPEISIEEQPQRIYKHKLAAHLLGYIGQVNPKQLDIPALKTQDTRPATLLGRAGLKRCMTVLRGGMECAE
jgi:cell division protein FtsI/penicillin-binding protein 2